MIVAKRSHEFCYGHRVVGHEGKCKQLHGHGGVVHFYCKKTNGSLDDVGRVVDFSVIKSTLCAWLEDNWDHRMLIWSQDPWVHKLQAIDEMVYVVPFNPTAENLSFHLLYMVGPILLADSGVELVKVEFEETGKCSATCSK